MNGEKVLKKVILNANLRKAKLVLLVSSDLGGFFYFLEMHLRQGPFKDTPVVKVWVCIYQQSGVKIEPGTAGWEARTQPLCHAVPLHPT